MKTRKGLERYQFLFTALLLAPWAWFSVREKAVGEAILYCTGLAASLFLTVLTLSGWGAKKTKQAMGQEEHQEEAKQ